MVKVLLVLGVLCAVVSAETLLGRAEPIPSDKCAASVTPYDDERLYVFSLSEDSVVWYKFQQFDGKWSSWRPLADRMKMSSGPKSVRFANGTMQVYARGTDRLYYVSTMTSLNEWSDWSSPFSDMEFLTPPTPVISSCDCVAVFGVSANTHTVWMSQSTPISSDIFQYSEWIDLGGDATGSVAAMVDGESLKHVFIRGTNRAVWHRAESYTLETGKQWGEWECLGGVMASNPKVPVGLNGANLLRVFGRAADKALWFREQTASLDTSVEWDAWGSLGGVLASGPSVALHDEGLHSVFARATDKAIYFKTEFEDEDNINRFTQWHTLGGMFSSSPSVVVRADGLIDVFARGVDKAIWHSHQIETNGTRAFSSWHSLGGHTRKYSC